ncbi:hypothetical protein L7F22_022608 [Adiantum nelumboides]|nr:hypothetical protein [Adiantum nelumboides]
MGDAMKVDGAFIGQDASVTPLIEKLRLRIQGYIDKEDFFISPLKHEDVILGAPWFDCLVASIKFPKRRISFKFREKNMYIDAQESGNTIPLVHTHAFDKSIKSSIFVYMIFVKDSLSDVNKTQVNESGSQEDLELFKFLNQFQDVFIDDISGELPPKQGDDDHAIELIPGSSPPNKLPYRVSQAQQEEIMKQVNELVEKGMMRPSSSPFCSPVLLVHKKNGTYRMRVNYRAINKITIKNRFLVPRIEDLFDKLQGSTYFSRIDLKSGYHQIRIVNEDILKTAFRTTFGLYEYPVMPFGLTNVPATFNRMMERIFRPHRNFTEVFFNVVIIYSKSMEEHKKHLLSTLDVCVNKLTPTKFCDDEEYDLVTLQMTRVILESGSDSEEQNKPTQEIDCKWIVDEISVVDVEKWIEDKFVDSLSDDLPLLDDALPMLDADDERSSESKNEKKYLIKPEVFIIFQIKNLIDKRDTGPKERAKSKGDKDKPMPFVKDKTRYLRLVKTNDYVKDKATGQFFKTKLLRNNKKHKQNKAKSKTHEDWEIRSGMTKIKKKFEYNKLKQTLKYVWTTKWRRMMTKFNTMDVPSRYKKYTIQDKKIIEQQPMRKLKEPKTLDNGPNKGKKIDLAKPGEEPKPIYITTDLTKEEEELLIATLKQCKDVFAWSYKDLKVLDPSICQQTISLKSDAKPSRQRLYTYNKTFAKKIKEEIDKLKEMEFIYEIEHTD